MVFAIWIEREPTHQVNTVYKPKSKAQNHHLHKPQSHLKSYSTIAKSVKGLHISAICNLIRLNEACCKRLAQRIFATTRKS